MSGYLLFFSRYCEHCRKFIRALEGSGQATYFNKVCVDKNENGHRPKIMYQYKISEVPTIIVENKKISDIAAFKWLHNRIQHGGPNTAMNTRNNKLDYNMRKHEMDESGTLQPFFQGDSHNITDNCLSISDENPVQGGIYTPIDSGEIISREDKLRRFNLPIDSITGSMPEIDLDANILPPLTGKREERDQLKARQLDNEYSKMMAERELGIPKPHPRR